MDTVVIYGRAVNFVLTVDPNRVAEGIVELATVWDIQMRVGRANELLIFRRIWPVGVYNKILNSFLTEVIVELTPSQIFLIFQVVNQPVQVDHRAFAQKSKESRILQSEPRVWR